MAKESISIVKQLESIIEDICDNYCKWPERYPCGESDEAYDALMHAHCDTCPFNEVF